MSQNATISRPRYELLDGLRGVAAILVIWYHFFEGFATSSIDQCLNHGYLAVDFFFVLSGFVIGYAYDGRFQDDNITPWRFMLRRVIRLHPMVILSVILGGVAFLLQGSVQWDGTPVSPGMVISALVLGLFLIPVLPGAGVEVRGNGEMFPLNGPSWSLFFEYIGNILYAFVLHRLSTRTLRYVTIASGIGLASVLVGNMSGAFHAGMGWSIADWGWIGGFLRLSFSFSAGLLMSRTFKRRNIRGAFWICSIVISLLLSCPYVSTDGGPSVLNGIYDCLCTLFVFPALVYLGACGTTTDRHSTRICDFLGQLSYPVYIIHYPVMYLFYAWVWSNGLDFASAYKVCIALFFLIITMAYVSMKYYDNPVRRYLTRHLVSTKERS